MSLYDKLKSIQNENGNTPPKSSRDAPKKAEVKPKAEESTELPQCECGSHIAGECPECSKVEPDPEIVERLKKIGDERAINPPAIPPTEAPDANKRAEPIEDTSETPPEPPVPSGEKEKVLADADSPDDGRKPCPTCGKRFKRLGKHRCKAEPVIVGKNIDRTGPVDESPKAHAEVLDDYFPADTRSPEDSEESPKTPTITSPAYDLFIDCMIYLNTETGETAQYFPDIIAPIGAQVAKEYQAPCWNAIEYGKGPGLLATALEKWIIAVKPEGRIMLLSGSPEYRACRDVLMRHARTVIMGVM